MNRPSYGITKWVSAAIAVLALVILASDLRSPRYPAGFDYAQLARLPIQEAGRMKPLDTVARTSLMAISGKQSYRDVEGLRYSAIEWLTELMLHPQLATRRPVFRIDHPDLVGAIGFKNEQRKYFSLAEIGPHFESLQEQFANIPAEQQLQNSYQKALRKLQNALGLYDRLGHFILPPPFLGDLRSTVETLQRIHADGIRVEPGSELQRTVDNARSLLSQQFQSLSLSSIGQPIPPNPAIGQHEWISLGDSLLAVLDSGYSDPLLLAFDQLAMSYQQRDAAGFNAALAALVEAYADRGDPDARKTGFEAFFNHFAPFASAMKIYVLVLLVAAFSWLGWARQLALAAFWLLLVAFLIHTFGMFARVYIQARPPVTNLYSSAIFVSWAAIPICLWLERRSLSGIPSAAAALLGFTTLIVAHHLSFSGDTLEVMRAVLDSNFWLATHVPTVTIGYSASFLAGFLAIVYILRLWIQGPEVSSIGSSISNMVYGTICFALLFSFVGTVLGGIWADQSWGRFWGWDPKENGALMIVLWNALILHARWAKIATVMGIMQLAIVGNIITAWSWFGTNMLGVGLHSYGFMDAAFFWLMAFNASQAAIILLGYYLSRRAG